MLQLVAYDCKCNSVLVLNSCGMVQVQLEHRQALECLEKQYQRVSMKRQRKVLCDGWSSYLAVTDEWIFVFSHSH